MRRLLSVLVATGVLLGLAVRPSTAADAPHFHSDARGSVVIEDRTGNGSWSAALSYATAEWNRAGVLTITHRAGSGSCDAPVAGVIVVCQRSMRELHGAHGETYAYAHDGHLSASVVLVCSDCAGDTRKRVIAAHEVGHALGLGHVDDGRSLMCSTGCASGPTAEDVGRLRANHAHEDAATGSGQAATARTSNCLLTICF